MLFVIDVHQKQRLKPLTFIPEAPDDVGRRRGAAVVGESVVQFQHVLGRFGASGAGPRSGPLIRPVQHLQKLTQNLLHGHVILNTWSGAALLGRRNRTAVTRRRQQDAEAQDANAADRRKPRKRHDCARRRDDMKYRDDVRVRDTCAGPPRSLVSLRPDRSMWCERKNSLVLVNLVIEGGGQDYGVDPLVLTSLEMLPLGLWAFHSVSGFLTLPVSSFHACLSQTSSSNVCALNARYIHIYIEQTLHNHLQKAP